MSVNPEPLRQTVPMADVNDIHDFDGTFEAQREKLAEMDIDDRDRRALEREPVPTRTNRSPRARSGTTGRHSKGSTSNRASTGTTTSR